MNFTKTLPQQPGLFAARPLRQRFMVLIDVYLSANGNLEAVVNGYLRYMIDLTDYEWCRLVPSEEVEEAFCEGWTAAVKLPIGFTEQWNNSRAKRVSEGKE